LLAGTNAVPNTRFNKKTELMWLISNTETRATCESEQLEVPSFKVGLDP